jgi:hypothetical protein
MMYARGLWRAAVRMLVRVALFRRHLPVVTLFVYIGVPALDRGSATCRIRLQQWEGFGAIAVQRNVFKAINGHQYSNTTVT